METVANIDLVKETVKQYGYLLDKYVIREAINNEEDFETYLKIKSDDLAIKFSGFETPPERNKLRKAFNKIFCEKQFLFYIIDRENGKVCSSFHIKIIDKETVQSMGCNVFPECRGKKIGWITIYKSDRYLKKLGYNVRYGYVSENNIPSIKNLEKAGAYATGEYEMRELKAFHRELKFLKYKVDL